MLVLHSSSRCDVCLSDYSWENSAAQPHAIQCGHIFCRDCLFTTNPPLCPLCRKPYLPNKMKKLHVDRPENIDDHKEIDLLQRLAISWETSPDQLEVVMTEVDLWLRARADDTCVPLRKARTALENHLRLKDIGSRFDETVQRLEREVDRLTYNVVNEQHKLKVVSKGYNQTVDELQSQVTNLNLELERFRTQPYTRYTRSHNPLPAPPEPISTDHIPTFHQAVLASGASSTRYADLPTSPASSSYPQFEIERRTRKGKTKLPGRQYVSDPRHPTPGPTTHDIKPHLNPQPPTYEQSSSYTTRTPGLQYDFDNATQPLDPFSLTHAYLKEYSVGYINGQAYANERRTTELSDNRRTHHPQASGSSRQIPQTAGVYESSSNYREPPLNAHQNQSYSEPTTGERPSHRRRDTPTSISSSQHKSSSSSRSRSQSRQRRSSSGGYRSNPLAASILSSPPLRPPSRRLSTPPTPSSRSVSFRATTLVTEPEELSNPVPASVHRGSPSAQSRRTLESGSWGTNTPSHLTRGSLMSHLLNFRFGSDNALSEGGEMVFRPLDSDGVSIRTRETSISDAVSEAASYQPSPARPVHSMVGVLPGDEEVISVPSQSNRNSYRSPTSVDARSNHSNGWDTSNSSQSRVSASTHGSSYQRDEDHVQNQRVSQALSSNSRWSYQSHSRDDRADSYRHHQQPQDDTSHSNDRQGRSNHGQASRAPRSSHRALLPVESPFPITVDYTDDDHNSLPHGSPASVMPSFGNALGLELTTGPTPISAPTPIVSNTAFLRTFSRDHYES